MILYSDSITIIVYSVKVNAAKGGELFSLSCNRMRKFMDNTTRLEYAYSRNGMGGRIWERIWESCVLAFKWYPSFRFLTMMIWKCLQIISGGSVVLLIYCSIGFSFWWLCKKSKNEGLCVNTIFFFLIFIKWKEHSLKYSEIRFVPTEFFII